MDLLSGIIGLIAGLIGGFTLKVVIDARRSTSISRSRQNDSPSAVSQTSNLAGGDIAGRDIDKRGK